MHEKLLSISLLEYLSKASLGLKCIFVGALLNGLGLPEQPPAIPPEL
jgi:hypothetical protein